jgi:hypothetical protein
VIEKDHIKELFSNSLEQHSMPVRPEVWSGLQAKMAAAGLTSTAAAAKGISVLTKWIIGGTAAAVVGVTTVIVMQSNEPTQRKDTNSLTKEQSTSAVQKSPNEMSNEESQPFDAPSNTNIQRIDQQQVQQMTEGSGPSSDFTELLVPQVLTESKELPVLVPTIIYGMEYSPFAEENTKQAITPQKLVELQREEPVVQAKEAELLMPNVFNPNGDGINDEYFVTSAHITEAEIIIQNVNNDVVFRSNDIHFRWNGRINGTEDHAANGMYACMIIYKDEAGKSHKRIQLLNLIR